MGKIKRIIPFWFWPRNWGASGPSKEIDEAHYYYDGEDLDYRVLDIKYPDKTTSEYKREKAKLDFKYEKISRYEYKKIIIETDPFFDLKTKQKALLMNDLDAKLITEEEYEYKILDITHDSKYSKEYLMHKAELDFEYNKISEYTYKKTLLDLKYSNEKNFEYRSELNELNFDFDVITEEEYEIEKLKCDFEDDIENPEYKKKYAELQLRFGKISDYDYEIELAKIEYPEDSNDYKLKILEIDHKHHKIDQNTYEKETANILEIPWFNMISGTFLQDEDSLMDRISVEYDWNSHFIDYLRSYGWTGLTDEDVFMHWMQHMHSRMFETEYDENLSPVDMRIQRNEKKKIKK